jgi:hypothetical protein
MFSRTCGINSAVECQLPKLKVAGSNPVSRSIFRLVLRIGAHPADGRRHGVGPRCDPRHVPTFDDSSPPKLSRKEQARQLRRAAYLKAKEQRANDPRLIAIKEAMKKRRREANQAAKERRKAAVAEQDRKQRERQAEERANKDAAGN